MVNALAEMVDASEITYFYDKPSNVYIVNLRTQNINYRLDDFFAWAGAKKLVKKISGQELRGNLTFGSLASYNKDTKEITPNPAGSEELKLALEAGGFNAQVYGKSVNLLGKYVGVGTFVGFDAGNVRLGLGYEITKRIEADRLDLSNPDSYDKTATINVAFLLGEPTSVQKSIVDEQKRLEGFITNMESPDIAKDKEKYKENRVKAVALIRKMEKYRSDGLLDKNADEKYTSLKIRADKLLQTEK
jgi:hypothetical protein